MKLIFSEGSKICDKRDHQLHFDTETRTFELWSQNLRLILIHLESVLNFLTDTETFCRWSQSLRVVLGPPWSPSQSQDQSLAHLCTIATTLMKKFYKNKFKRGRERKIHSFVQDLNERMSIKNTLIGMIRTKVSKRAWKTHAYIPDPSCNPCEEVLQKWVQAETRKHTILPRNCENFSEASYFFGGIFCTFWSFLGRMFHKWLFHIFVTSKEKLRDVQQRAKEKSFCK